MEFSTPASSRSQSTTPAVPDPFSMDMSWNASSLLSPTSVHEILSESNDNALAQTPTALRPVRKGLETFQMDDDGLESLYESFTTVDRDIIVGLGQCYARNLNNSVKWLSDLRRTFNPENSPVRNFLVEEEIDDESFSFAFDPFDPESSMELLGKTYLESGEFLRAAHATRTCRKPLGKFLHFYGRYLGAEKARKDRKVGLVGLKHVDPKSDKEFKIIYDDLVEYMEKDENYDPFMPYIIGLLEERFGNIEDAREAYALAITKAPMNWDAWERLAIIAELRENINELDLPEHWMRHFFDLKAYQELQMNQHCAKLGSGLFRCGFSKFNFVSLQVAIAFHNMQNPDVCVDVFTTIRASDPFDMEAIDLLSNSFFVMSKEKEIAYLAQEVLKTDKYRFETQCVLANLYSLRGEHGRCILLFERALKLNPAYTGGWTLLGHEYMEMGDVASAIHHYQKALDFNKTDYRAWYGLGQTFEILKMHHKSLFYYQNAQKLRPYDARMFVALGLAYDNLKNYSFARMCFERASQLGDSENMSLFLLAGVYVKLNMDDLAARAYTRYIDKVIETGLTSLDMLTDTHRFLAMYFIRTEKYCRARMHALALQQYVHSRQEAKRFLELISDKVLGPEPFAIGWTPPHEPEEDAMELGPQAAEEVNPFLLDENSTDIEEVEEEEEIEEEDEERGEDMEEKEEEEGEAEEEEGEEKEEYEEEETYEEDEEEDEVEEQNEEI